MMENVGVLMFPVTEIDETLPDRLVYFPHTFQTPNLTKHIFLKHFFACVVGFA